MQVTAAFFVFCTLFCFGWLVLFENMVLPPVHLCISSSWPQKEHLFGDWFCSGPILTSQTSRFHAETNPSTPPQKFNKDPHQKKINGVSKFGISGETTNIFPFSGEKNTSFSVEKPMGKAHHFQVNQPVVKPQGCSNQFLRPGVVFCWAWQLLASLPNWWGKPNRFWFPLVKMGGLFELTI